MTFNEDLTRTQNENKKLSSSQQHFQRPPRCRRRRRRPVSLRVQPRAAAQVRLRPRLRDDRPTRLARLRQRRHLAAVVLPRPPPRVQSRGSRGSGSGILAAVPPRRLWPSSARGQRDGGGGRHPVEQHSLLHLRSRWNHNQSNTVSLDL